VNSNLCLSRYGREVNKSNTFYGKAQVKPSLSLFPPLKVNSDCWICQGQTKTVFDLHVPSDAIAVPKKESPFKKPKQIAVNLHLSAEDYIGRGMDRMFEDPEYEIECEDEV
jgi:hypothetical protein